MLFRASRQLLGPTGVHAHRSSSSNPDSLSGRGAIDLCRAVGVPPWSILDRNVADFRADVLLPELTVSDILINCAHLCPKFYPSLVVDQALAEPKRHLRVLCDATLDGATSRCWHPSVLDYTKLASFKNATMSIPSHDIGPSLMLVSLHHLPNLVAREASDEFARSLLPILLTLNNRETESVWKRAKAKFHDTVELLLLGGETLEPEADYGHLWDR